MASGIFGGISNRKARKRQERMLARQQQENQAWYDRKYNEDPTKRADTVRLLTQMQEQIRDRNKAAKGRQAVMGGTDDAAVAAAEANSKAIADTTADIVARNDARKDSIEQQYMQRKQNLQNGQMQLEAEKADTTANVVQGVLGTAANIAAALDGAGASRGTAGSGTTRSAADMAGLGAQTQKNLDEFGRKNADRLDYPNYTGGKV